METENLFIFYEKHGKVGFPSLPQTGAYSLVHLLGHSSFSARRQEVIKTNSNSF